MKVTLSNHRRKVADQKSRRRDRQLSAAEQAAIDVANLIAKGDPYLMQVLRFWMRLIPKHKLPAKALSMWSADDNRLVWNSSEFIVCRLDSAFLDTNIGRHFMAEIGLPRMQLLNMAGAVMHPYKQIQEAREMVNRDPIINKAKQYISGQDVTIAPIGEEKRWFYPNLYRGNIVDALTEWWPSRYRGKSLVQAEIHSSKNNLCRPEMLHYVPGLAKARRVAAYEFSKGRGGVPWVVTDRFIVDLYDDNGHSYVPDKFDDEQLVRVRFMEKKVPVEMRDGWLCSYGGFLGCSQTKSDAMKAAKMKAVRAAKEKLGIL